MKYASVYLNYNGNAEEAFRQYEKVFGTKIDSLMRFGDGPDGANLPEAERGMVMHISLPLPGGFPLMASDTPASTGNATVFGTESSIYLETESPEEADRYFAGLSEGGKVDMPMADTFWGSYFGALKDRFGIQWMISYTKEGETPAGES